MLGVWPVAGITTSAESVVPFWRYIVMGSPEAVACWKSSAGILTREPRISLDGMIRIGDRRGVVAYKE